MSEDDRAAKAARAKALLKRKKKGGAAAAASGASVASPAPGSPLSRAYSPAPSDIPAQDEEQNDLGDAFAKPPAGAIPSDVSWLASLERVGSPSIPSTPPVSSSPLHPAPLVELPPPAKQSQPSLTPPPASAIPIPPTLSIAVDETENFRSVIQNQQQTISLLVSEKASLSASLERLSDIESKTQESERLLQDERANNKALTERVLQLEADAHKASGQIEELSAREKTLEDNFRDQERELQLTKGAADEFQAEAERSHRRVRELEEQIQSDDRVERLEASLQNVQDHASELEFQLSKLRQTQATVKSERDELETQLQSRIVSESAWESKHADLQRLHDKVEQQLAALLTENKDLFQEKADLQSRLGENQKQLSDVQASVSQVTSDHASITRQLQSTQSELRAALRRAEEAERLQQDLQAEGTSLMRSLDEMRPKIVELTDAKLELTERASRLERTLRDRDSVIVHLETSLQMLRDEAEAVNARLRDVEALREKDRGAAQENLGELQRGYSELQAELDGALVSIRELETERQSQRQLAARQMAEIERLTGTSQTLKEETSSLRAELEERNLAAAEQQEFLERARTDIEILRGDVVVKEEEIELLRAEISAVAASNLKSTSLDKEMLSALRQQHALELSASQSQIRALQTSVFEAEAKAHALQKHASALEDQLAHLRPAPPARASPKSSPPGPATDRPSRPSSRSRNHSDDLRRASLSRKTNGTAAAPPPPSSQSLFGQNLSPETRHKRKVSLSMLKARIDSEVAAATGSSHPSSRAVSPAPGAPVVLAASGASRLPTVPEPANSPATLNHLSFKHPQFLDDSHIFWCHSCRGELVIL